MSSETNECTKDISNLQESFQQQQEKISALKKLVHKADRAHGSTKLAAQEKVKSIAERLKISKARSRQGLNVSTYSTTETKSGDTSVASAKDRAAMLSTSHISIQSLTPNHASTPQPTPTKANENDELDKAVTAPVSGSEKILLMRQQLEQNRLRLAQKATSKQHLEQLVTQLKVKFDSTQQSLADASELGKSMSDLSNLMSTSSYRERHMSSIDLSGPQSFNLEKERMKFLENRCRLLEKQLEKEKQLNDQRQKETSEIDIMGSKIEQLQQSLLEKEKLCEQLESNLKQGEEKQKRRLAKAEGEDGEQGETDPSAMKNLQLLQAEEPAVDLIAENNRLHNEIDKHLKRIKELTDVNDLLEVSRCELSTKVTQLEEQFRQRQQLLEEEAKDPATTNTDIEVQSEMAKKIQQLTDDVNALRKEKIQLQGTLNEKTKINITDSKLAEKIADLESTIETQKLNMQKSEEELTEKQIELNVLNANFKAMEEQLENALKSKPLFASVSSSSGGIDSTEAVDINKLQLEIVQLKQKMDDSNKHSIKMKLKCKQSEKEVEKLKKRIKELEEVEAKAEEKDDSIEKTNQQCYEVELVELRNTLKEKNQLLEQMQAKLTSLESVAKEKIEALEVLQQDEQYRVKTELSEIQWEEQIKHLTEQLRTTQKLLDTKDKELLEYQEKFNNVSKQKEEVDKKLEHYIHENIELLDKVEQLSKSSSSAESIEIVERLTQQEHAELEEYNKAQGLAQMTEEAKPTTTSPHEMVSEHIPTDLQPEMNANDALLKLREESCELKSKIELFTNERKEVLDKMEHISNENQYLQQQIERLKEEKSDLENKLHRVTEEKQQLEEKMLTLNKEKDTLAVQVAETQAQKAQLSQGLTSMQQSSEVMAALDKQDCLFDKCEKSLAKLSSELKAYRKANDKNAKFNVSKKLAKEAENAHTQLSELLQKVKEASNAVETVTVVETVVAVTAPNGKALAEYEQLTAQNQDLKARINELKQQLDDKHEESEDQDNQTEHALHTAQEQLTKSEEQHDSLMQQCQLLQQQVDNLTEELKVERIQLTQKDRLITQQEEELIQLRNSSENFDRLLNNAEMSYEQRIEQLTRSRQEWENKCEMYEQQVDMMKRCNEQQQHDNLALIEQTQQLREDSNKQQRHEGEWTKLKENLQISNDLVKEQCNELANKQITIDALNEEIQSLYKTIAEYNEKIVKKNEEITQLQNQYEDNKEQVQELQREMQRLETTNTELEQHSKQQKDQLNGQRQDIAKQQTLIGQLEEAKEELVQRNKEQLEKLKKYAANLKKKVQQCQDYEQKEQKLHNLEQSLTEKTEELQQSIKLNERLQQEVQQLQEKLAAAPQMEADWTSPSEIDELRQQLQASQHQLQLKTEEIDKLKEERYGIEQQQQEQQACLQNELLCLQDNLTMKVQEIEKLRQQLMASEEQIADWGRKNDSLSTVSADTTVELKQVEQRVDELRGTLHEKDNIIHDLQTKCSSNQSSLTKYEKELNLLSEELQMKSMKFEKSKAVIKERNCQIKRLQSQLNDLQEKLTHLPEEEILSPKTQAQLEEKPSLSIELERVKEAYNKLNEMYEKEKTKFQNTIIRLETIHDGIQAKLQQDMAYIEILEQENNKYKDKIYRLEECVAIFEERRASMERKVKCMNAEMQRHSVEHSKTEDELIYRLNMLSEHDDIIARRLIDSQTDKETMEERVRRQQTELNEWQTKHSQLEKEYQKFQSQHSAEIETERNSWLVQLETVKLELQTIKQNKTDAEQKLNNKIRELDDLENQLDEQLKLWNAEKRTLSEQLERMANDCTLHQDEVIKLREVINDADEAKTELEREITWLRMQNETSQQNQYEVQELRLQYIQDKAEIENMRGQIERMVSNHETELQALRTQISELDTLRMQVGQNQTDDQVFIESENKRLADLLAEKSAIIENYQRQNLQLQVAMAAVNTNTSGSACDDLTATASTTGHSLATNFARTPASVSDEIETLRQELAEKVNLAKSLQQNLTALQTEFNNFKANRGNNQTPAEGNQEVNADNELHDVIPAPTMFFTTDTAVRTPFDDIHLTTTNQILTTTQQSPTIEALQRNVSDLEKHAQDLEHKLTARNQQVIKYEERVHNLEGLCEQNQNNLSTVQREYTDLLAEKVKDRIEWEQKLFEQEQQLMHLQSILSERNEELLKVRQELREEEQLKESIGLVEKQIISEPLETDIQPTLDMFFGNAGTSVFETFADPTEPVIEETIVPKKAYDCQPIEGAAPELPILDFGVDWSDSWTNNEAQAEAEHYAKVSTTQYSLITREQQLELQLQDVGEQIKELQQTLQQSEEQKKDLQTKYNKLGKKLKEYKAKIDELQSTSGENVFRKSSSVESNAIGSDLDAAIQEELKDQIKTLETHLADQRKQQELQTIEKEKLLKRIDVLSAGNDRMAEMKERQDREVYMYQARINELQEKLAALEDWGPETCSTDSPKKQATASNNVAIEEGSFMPNVKDLEDRISALSLEVQDLNGDRSELQALLDEERAELAKAEQTIQTLRQQINVMQQSPANVADLKSLQQSYNDLLSTNIQLTNELEILQRNLTENQAQKNKLNIEVNNIKEKLLSTEAELSSLKNVHNKEMKTLKKHNEDLQTEVHELQRINKQLQAEVQLLQSNQSNNIKDNREELPLLLLEKDSEIEHLKQRISDLMNEDQTEKLVLEILTKNQEIHLLRMQIKTLEDDKEEMEKHTIQEGIHKEEETQTDRNGGDEAKILELQQQLEELLSDKQQMEIELQVLNQHVLNTLHLEDIVKTLTVELDTKNNQIMELQKTRSGEVVDYTALNAQWEAIIDQRCSDIAKMWQDRLAQREHDFKGTEARLLEEIAALRSTTLRNSGASPPAKTEQPRQTMSGDNTTTTSTPASASSPASGSSSAEASKNPTPSHLRPEQENGDNNADTIIERMQVALESQELEIVTLKEQLAIRSAEYARLAAQYDPFKLQSSAPSDFKRNIVGDVDTVSKSQLDLALYILHQRDMRCEEMTLELTSLMEERDTLQLKLSNTLRQLETMKSQNNALNEAASTVNTAPSSDKAANTSANTLSVDDDVELNAKLSQLQMVKHSKDKVMNEEREQRLRQMEKIQQDIAKIPPAAVSELIGSDLTQTTQSASTALLNWLWGNKNTNSTHLQQTN